MMNRMIKLRRGLDIPLAGEALDSVADMRTSVDEVALCPDHFPGFVPRLLVKEGDYVSIGTPLMVDKRGGTTIVSTVSGTVSGVDRGERRKLESVRVKSDGKATPLPFGPISIEDADADAVVDLMCRSGIAALVRQRPYDIVPVVSQKPRDIFISAFSTMPLAADSSIVLRGMENDFCAGVRALSKIAPVRVGISPRQSKTAFASIDSAEVNVFNGPNPAGNVGVQIANTYPIGKGDVVWTLGYWAVAVLGRLATTGVLDFSRRIALAGTEVEQPGYVETIAGASIHAIVGGRLRREEHVRIISGNPLVGEVVGMLGWLSPMSGEITAIAEGDDVSEVLGWMRPRLSQFSASHAYFSRFFPHRRYALDSRIKGGERHMIMSGEYDRVMPMHIYAGYLIKAIIAKDIDRMEQLGIYEVAPEDFAVAEFVDSSKLELQRIVREGLDMMRGELE